MRLLRQPQFNPYSQHEQVIILVTAMAHMFQNIAPTDIESKVKGLLQYFKDNEMALCGRIDSTGKLEPEDREEILEAAKKFFAQN